MFQDKICWKSQNIDWLVNYFMYKWNIYSCHLTKSSCHWVFLILNNSYTSVILCIFLRCERWPFFIFLVSNIYKSHKTDLELRQLPSLVKIYVRSNLCGNRKCRYWVSKGEMYTSAKCMSHNQTRNTQRFKTTHTHFKAISFLYPRKSKYVVFQDGTKISHLDLPRSFFFSSKARKNTKSP